MKIPLTAGVTFNRERERAKNLLMKKLTDSLSIHHTDDATHVRTVTGWYEAGQLPVRSGVYETTLTGDGRFRGFNYFDGANWYEGGGTPNDALRNFQERGVRRLTPLPWRGLTEKAT